MQTLEWLQEPDPRLSPDLGALQRLKGKASRLTHLCWWEFGVVGPLRQWERRLCTITARKDGGLQAALRSDTTRGFLGVFAPVSKSRYKDCLCCCAMLDELSSNELRCGHRVLLAGGQVHLILPWCASSTQVQTPGSEGCVLSLCRGLAQALRC